MNVLIVEDEPISARRLSAMISAIDPGARIAAIMESVRATVAWLQTHPMPDLLLMDIELTDGKSFDIFEQVSVSAPVIFVTAYDEYAIRAFRVNSIDYLLKPVKQEELSRALGKFRSLSGAGSGTSGPIDMRALLQELQAQSGYKDRFLIRQGDRLLPVETGDIAYFQTRSKFNYIRTTDGGEYAIDMSLDEIERAVDPKRFFRANRQFIVSAAAVRKIHFWFSAKLKVDLAPDPGEEVVVSREKAMAFRHWMGE